MLSNLNFEKKYELTGIFLLANLLSWALGILLALQAQGWCEPGIPFSMHYLYAFGPTRAAFIQNAETLAGCMHELGLQISHGFEGSHRQLPLYIGGNLVVLGALFFGETLNIPWLA